MSRVRWPLVRVGVFFGKKGLVGFKNLPSKKFKSLMIKLRDANVDPQLYIQFDSLAKLYDKGKTLAEIFALRHLYLSSDAQCQNICPICNFGDCLDVYDHDKHIVSKEWKMTKEQDCIKVYPMLHNATPDQIQKKFEELSLLLSGHDIFIPSVGRYGCLTFVAVRIADYQVSMVRRRERYIMSKMPAVRNKIDRAKESSKSGHVLNIKLPLYGPMTTEYVSYKVATLYTYMCQFILNGDERELIPLFGGVPVTPCDMLPSKFWFPRAVYSSICKTVLKNKRVRTEYFHGAQIFELDCIGEPILNDLPYKVISPLKQQVCLCGEAFPVGSIRADNLYREHLATYHTGDDIPNIPKWARNNVVVFVTDRIEDLPLGFATYTLTLEQGTVLEKLEMALGMEDLDANFIHQEIMKSFRDLDSKRFHIIAVEFPHHVPTGMMMAEDDGSDLDRQISRIRAQFCKDENGETPMRWGDYVYHKLDAEDVDDVMNNNNDDDEEEIEEAKVVEIPETRYIVLPWCCTPERFKKYSVIGSMTRRQSKQFWDALRKNEHASAFAMYSSCLTHLMYQNPRMIIVDADPVLPVSVIPYARIRPPFKEFINGNAVVHKRNKLKLRVSWLIRHVYKTEYKTGAPFVELANKVIANAIDNILA
jgi:hypothetical protein